MKKFDNHSPYKNSRESHDEIVVLMEFMLSEALYAVPALLEYCFGLQLLLLHL